MADYEPGRYRSGFEDDERRSPYATDFGARNERYATGYGYGPTYGGTAGAYGATYGGVTPGTYGYGTTGAYGYGATGYGSAGYGTTGAHNYGTTGYGTTSSYGATGTGYGSIGGYESGYGTGRFGSTRIGRREPANFGTYRQGTGTWREEAAGERRYPDYTHGTAGWASQQESRFGEPGRAGIRESATGLQEFGAYTPGIWMQRRRIGNRQYGPY